MEKSNMRDVDAMEDKEEEELQRPIGTLDETSDFCERLMERYGKSRAPQHRYLCASAAAMRAILQEEGLPLTTPAYFAASITAINDAADTVDTDAMGALSSFFSMLLPLVPGESLSPSKASDAVTVLIMLLGRPGEALSTATVRSVIKSMGFLMGFCDLDDWNLVKLPLETILKFSIDRRPKVRRCAQVCLEKVFQSFRSSVVRKEASKMVLYLFKSYMPLASALRIVDESKSEILSKPEHLEVVHMLNTLKLIFSYLSDKVCLKVLSELNKLMNSRFSPLTRQIFNIIEAFFETSRAEVMVEEVENVIIVLVSYVSSGEKNPVETVLAAATLLKGGLDKLRASERSIWIRNLPLVFGSLAGMLISEADNASQAAVILKELIKQHMDWRAFFTSERQLYDGEVMCSAESSAIRSTCVAFEQILSNFSGVPNEHILAVLTDLFLKLGEFSCFFMKDILLKLSKLASLANGEVSDTKHIHECIGSAIIAMGPEEMLKLVPISLDAENFTCSNIWLIPILKKYVIGASLRYYMEHIVPLAKSLKRACRKVKNSPLQDDLLGYSCGLWGLLPSFCHYPTDTCVVFDSLAELFIKLLKKDSLMHENIAFALQELVNQNRSIIGSSEDASVFSKQPGHYFVKNSLIVSGSVPSHYSKETAEKNLRALASCSVDLLQALADVFFTSPPERRSYLKDAIGCLASISKASNVERIFVLSLDKYQITNSVSQTNKPEEHSCTSVNEAQRDATFEGDNGSERCIIMEFASSIVEGANEELINLIFNLVRSTLQATYEIGQREAYYALSKILEKHTWFCMGRFGELMDLLLRLNPPVDIMSLRCRFECFRTLLVHILKSGSEEMNEKAFLLLNEIIITLKDSKEGTRKTAYDILPMISSRLKNASFGGSDLLHQRLLSMIIGYLSGASPHIMSGAVAALSLLIYKDTDVCFSVPELVPSVLVLLKSKSVEIIKAVLGFVKVLVSCLQTKDLLNFLMDIVNGILPWSFVSRHHFRSKVTVILEIVIRKCGSASVESIIPEKYRDFVKTVSENHHWKTSCKDAGTTDAEPKDADTSLKGQQKRKSRELSNKSEISKETRTTQRKRRKKYDSSTPSTNEPQKSINSGSLGKGTRISKPSHPVKQVKDQSRSRWKNNYRKDTVKRRDSGAKGKIWRTKVNNMSQRPVSGAAVSSKVHNSRKVVR